MGMQTLDQCLKNLVQKGLITRQAAREKAKIPTTSDDLPRPNPCGAP
jgi:Tfp pilus assembly pilus retraction ATPase PilT